MANLIKIKRSTTTATPTSLSEGELAYSESSDNLFIGTSGGNVTKVGGNLDVSKLAGIASGAEVNVKPDFNASSGDAQILNVPDPKITLAGDLSGSVTLTNLGNGTLTATVADDSHNHIIGNVDGLQSALDAKSNNHSHPYLSSSHDASGVTSAKISNWDSAHSWYSTMTTADADGVIDTVNEIVSAFQNHAEGLNLISELDSKLTASSTIDGGTF